jgi:hypothetical protein
VPCSPGRDRRSNNASQPQQDRSGAQIDQLQPGLGTFEGVPIPDTEPSVIDELDEKSTRTVTVPPICAQLKSCSAFCALTSEADVPWYPESLRRQQRELLHLEIYQIPAHKIPDPRSSLCRSYADFGNAHAGGATDGGVADSDKFGIDPVVDLLFRDHTPSDGVTYSAWACGIARNLTRLDVYTQLGYCFLLERLIRWCSVTNLKSWTLLPPLIRPIESQRYIPHYVSADIQPIPAIRDALVHGRTTLEEPVGNLQRAGTTKIHMHWPFGMDEAVEEDPHTGRKILSRLFQAAAGDESNWSCGTDFMDSMPPGEVHIIPHYHEWQGEGQDR